MSSDTEKGGRSTDSNEMTVADEAAGLFSSHFTSPWIYFYHLTADHQATRAYKIRRRDSVPYDEVPDAIDDIFEDLPEIPHGYDIGDLAWRNKGYLVFVFEDTSQKIRGVTFKRQQGEGNNTFRHGKLLSSVAGRTDVSAFYCVNYMLSRHDVDLNEDEAEVFRVKVNHGQSFADIDLPFLGHDDAGTNLGPPVPPPP